MGSIVNYGRGKGSCVRNETELGKIAGMIESFELKTPCRETGWPGERTGYDVVVGLYSYWV